MYKLFTNKTTNKKITVKSVTSSGNNRIVNQEDILVNSNHEMFIRLQLSNFTTKDVITDTKLLFKYKTETEGFELRLYEDNVFNINTINKTTASSLNGKYVEDRIKAKTKYGSSLAVVFDNASFDISKIIRRAIKNNKTEVYLRVKNTSNTNFTIKDVELLSADEVILQGYSFEAKGMNEAFYYDQQEMGTAGISNINLFTGKNILINELYSTIEEKMPISVSHVYIQDNYVSNKTGLFGRGTKASFEYDLIKTNEELELIDSFNNSSYYVKIGISDAQYLRLNISEDFTGDIYYNNVDSSFALFNNNKYAFNDTNGNIMEFDIIGGELSLKSIETVSGEKTAFIRNSSNKVVSIQRNKTYSSVVSIKYNANNYISEIRFEKEKKLFEFSYTNNSLKEIKVFDYETTIASNSPEQITKELLGGAKYSYNSYGLISASDTLTLFGYNFEYFTNGKIKKTQISVNNGSELGESSLYEYNDQVTKITSNYGDVSMYYFDALGRNKLIMDKYGSTVSYNYDEIKDGISSNLIGESNVQTHSKNMIENHSFDADDNISDGLLGWELTKGNQTKLFIEHDGVYGEKCLLVDKHNLENVKIKQKITNPLTGTQTLRGFIKYLGIDGLPIENDDVIAQMNVKYSRNETISIPSGSSSSGSTSSTTEVVHYNKSHKADLTFANGKWQEFSVSFDIPSGAYDLDLEIELIMSGKEAKIYFDDLQLIDATGESKHRYNYVENGYMEFIQNNKPKGWTFTDVNISMINELVSPYHASNLGEKVVHLKPKANKTAIMKKNVPMIGNAGDELIFSLLAKSYATVGDIFSAYLKIHYTDTDTYQTFNFDFESLYTDWQVLTRSITAEYPYDSIEVGVKYDGLNGASFDAIQLYKDSYGKHYNYNEKGGLIEASNSEGGSSTIEYDDKNQIKEVSDESGDNYKYTYDDKNRIKTTKDIYGNVVSYDYDENGNKTKSLLENHSKTEKFMTEITYDENNNPITEVNERRETTSNTFDELNKLITSIAPNGLKTNHKYNAYGELTEKYSKLGLADLKGKYIYDQKGQVTKIEADDHVSYNFEYDSFGNVTKILVDNHVFAKYTYKRIGNINTGLVETQQFGDSGDKYKFRYDSKRRLDRIQLNSTTIVSYKYTDTDQVSEVFDSSNNTKYYFSYDLKGKLIKVTSKDATIKYTYDNLDSVQKTVIKIDEEVRDFDFEYKYEHNEYNLEGYIQRLDKAFKDDIILANHYADGKYGTKQLLRSVKYNQALNIYSFTKTHENLTLSLENVNSLRKSDYSRGSYFSSYKWNNDFKTNKNMYLWIKPKTTFGTQELLHLKEDNEKLITIGLNSAGKLTVKHLETNKSVDNNLKLELNKWNLLGFNLKQNDNDVQLLLSINGISQVIGLDDTKEEDSTDKPLVEQLNQVTIGNNLKNNTHSSTGNNPISNLNMPYDIFMIGVGAYEQSNDSFKGIHSEGIKYIGQTIVNGESSSGVTYYNHQLYKGLDVITLNGSLESQRGNKPVSFTYTDKSYKVDKTQIFKLDETDIMKQGAFSHTIRKHVYGSYDGLYNLTPGNKSKLIYDLGLRKKGTMSVRFKLDEDINQSQRYVLSTHSNSNEKIGIFIDGSNELKLILNGSEKSTGFIVSNKEWHTVVLRYSSGKVELFFNQETKKTFNITCDLTSTRTSIGAKVQSNEPTNHLYGVLEMFAYGENIIDNNQINQIIQESTPIIVRKKYDMLGRNTINEVIANDNRFVKELEFAKTQDGYTTLDVSKETSHDGSTIEYTYDVLGQIETKIHKKNGVVDYKYSYSYDGLGRIINELFEEGNIKMVTEYIYTKNNNILKVTEKKYVNNILQTQEIKEYTYGDSSYKDKLTSIDIVKKNADDQIIDEYTDSLKYNDTFMGNPSSIMKNGVLNNLTWKARRLTKFNTTNYTYNQDGIRIAKQNNLVDENYILEGKNIVALQNLLNRTKDVFFNYDEMGDLIGFTFKGKEYFYERDVSRIIHSIFDIDGNTRVKYKYNAWGKPEIINADGLTETNELMEINPFMYKGYFYDLESGWYYLKSRYYDPSIGRFINVDGEIGEIGDIANQNLFAYTGNNPVMFIDEDGNKMKWWHKVLVGVAVIAVVAVVAAVTVATAGAGSAAACIAVSALTGAIKGAAIGAVTGAVMGGAIGAVSGAIQTGTWEGAFQGLVSGAIDGAASGFMMGAITGAISGALNPKFCFVAGTLVLTEQGLKAIEEIKVGDKVASTNSNTGEKSFKEVLDIFVNKHKKLIDIKIGDEIITTTPDHPFYVNNLEWKVASELKTTDTLQNDLDEIIEISDLFVHDNETEIDTYNFEVEEFHTYYVGNHQILIHNACNSNQKVSPTQKGRDMQKTLDGYNNTKRIDVGGGRYRIPDKLTNTVIGEAKYVKYQSNTSQLRDYVMYAQKTNREMHLTIIKNVTKLSGPLQNVVDKGIIILKYFGG